jgi:cytochrome P450
VSAGAGAAGAAGLEGLVRIGDPLFYRDPYGVFARLRGLEGLFYCGEFDTFVVARHADVRAVSSDTSVFSTSPGTFLHDTQPRGAGEVTVLDSFFPHAENLGTTDGARHRELRQAISPAFTPRGLQGLRPVIEGICAELAAGLGPDDAGAWLGAATMLPVRVVAALAGLPEADCGQILAWTDEVEKMGDDAPLEELRAIGAEFSRMRDYMLERYREAQADPSGSGLLAVLARAAAGSPGLGEANVLMLAMLVVSAAGGTTRALLLALVLHLALRPGQLAAVRADRSLVPGAVEEALRYVPPVRAFLRTATRDAVVAGTPVRKGQHLYLMYMAANRDEQVFSRPEEFDVARPENDRQLAFGFGEHFCIGAPLARMEAAVMLNLLLDKFTAFELAGDPVPVTSVFRNSWHHMPILFHP